jgi:hypothetical protein
MSYSKLKERLITLHKTYGTRIAPLVTTKVMTNVTTNARAVAPKGPIIEMG